MSNFKKEKLIAIHSLSEIPTTFVSEDEERDWWARHYLSDELYEQLEDRTEVVRELIQQKCDKKEKS
ncbi:hypothetical protein HYR99_12990 [Candidatus Poribacteria bacterium]|nr:hypothetical protein [Candidatus Poribacteria bacterium]